MKPCKQFCFIAPDARPDKIGAIHLPETRAHTALPNVGTVKYLNPESQAEFKVGDRVIYNRHAQQLWPDIRGERLAQVRIEDVLAIL